MSQKQLDPFLVSDFSTSSKQMESVLVEKILHLAKTPDDAMKNNLIIVDLGKITLGIMPIIDIIFPKGAIAIRVFALNFTNTTSPKYTFSNTPFTKENPPALNDNLNTLRANTRVYFDFLLENVPEDTDKLYLAIGLEKKEAKEHLVVDQVKSQVWWNTIELDIKRIDQKPTTIEELNSTDYLGLHTKNYVDKRATGRILRNYFLSLEKSNFIGTIGMIVCCTLGIGLIYLPFYILKRNKQKKELIEYLDRLQLT